MSLEAWGLQARTRKCNSRAKTSWLHASSRSCLNVLNRPEDDGEGLRFHFSSSLIPLHPLSCSCSTLRARLPIPFLVLNTLQRIFFRSKTSFSIFSKFFSVNNFKPDAASVLVVPVNRDGDNRVTLTVQKELQMVAVQTGVSAGQLRAAASASQGVASGALLQIPSPMTMSSEDEE
jgi:hypothetical protein